MKYSITLMAFFILAGVAISCKKGQKEKQKAECLPGSTTVRRIVNQRAVVKPNGTIYGCFLIEEGSIDTKLIPCNLPMEFYQADLQVTISGDVKFSPADYPEPCCLQYFVITKITR